MEQSVKLDVLKASQKHRIRFDYLLYSYSVEKEKLTYSLCMERHISNIQFLIIDFCMKTKFWLTEAVLDLNPLSTVGFINFDVWYFKNSLITELKKVYKSAASTYLNSVTSNATAGK